MEGFRFVAEIFAFRWWIFWTVAILYLVPLLRLVTFPISLGHPFFMVFNRRLGFFEYFVAWFRDSLVVVYLFLGGLWYLAFGINENDLNRVVLGCACLILIGLTVANYVWKRNARRRLVDFVSHYPLIHPKEFFSHLLCSSGGVRHRLPKAPRHLIDPAHLDFRSPKVKRIGIQDIIAGIFSTMWCAKLSLLALKWKGNGFLREVASSLAVVWGSQLAALTRAEIIVEGRERLDELQGFKIYLFSHSSFLDFAVVPIFVAACKATLPRFLVAKNHFLDNPIFHRVLGIGRVALGLGMIFVERKENKTSARAEVEEAATKLVHDEIDLAIFPQGTRAVPKIAANGLRMEAGYYTVGRQSRMKRDGDHIKKGAAHIATCASQLLVKAETNADVNLIPVAIKGTSIIAPRGSMRFKPNVTVSIRVGEPITIKASEAKGIEGAAYTDFVRRLHSRVDNGLKTIVQIHAELERRLFEDMRTMSAPLDIEEMAIAMKPWRGDDYLVHAILDCIYACKPDDWYPLLGRLMYLIRNDAPREGLLAFKGEVVDKIKMT